MPWFFWFFFVSGFASLIYEVVWLRLAMAAFGVTTPFVSIVLSVFMAGLAIGSWAGGRIARRLEARPAGFDLRMYASVEMAIGIFGVCVPMLLTFGRGVIERIQGDAAWSGSTYCLVSGLWIALALLPGCTCMGATFPLAMSAIRKWAGESRSFSRLYLANVLGATSGTVVSAFVLIELFGFHGTLWVAAAMNALLALTAWMRGARLASRADGTIALSTRENGDHRGALGLLFATGLLSMGMEVVWVRQYTPHLGTVVYAFASILALYLLATFLGSTLYRSRAARSGIESVGPLAWIVAGALALTTLIAADPLVDLPQEIAWVELRTLLGIGPIAAAFGFLTPMLVDRFSGGDPDRAGRAYAVNVIGCILGPLVGCFLLLPWLGERWSIVALSLPLFAIGAAIAWRSRSTIRIPRVAIACAVVASLATVAFTHDFEARFRRSEVRRDSTATAIATTIRGEKQLYINGISISRLTPITKMMVHLPMAWRPTKPRSLLVICFGMGTSTRSGLTWGVPCTTVELCSVVPKFFAYFHPDAEKYLDRPEAEIVIDDGRRYLERTPREFDVITIDPPPPVEAAASSLLYSREFYQVIKRRLSPSGILQQWFPMGDKETLAAIIRSLQAEFPNLRAFLSVHGGGVHFLASREPLGDVTASELAARLPAEAAVDLVEWGPFKTSEQTFSDILSRNYALNPASLDPGGRELTDDRAVNEYFFLRRMFDHGSPRLQ
jgi:spermidine synthase